MMLTTTQIADCLRYQGLFNGEKCGAERIVSDKIVVSRKDHPHCFVCFGSMRAGSHNRVSAIVWDGEFLSSRVCEICCSAMAHSDLDKIEDCYSLGEYRQNGYLG